MRSHIFKLLEREQIGQREEQSQSSPGGEGLDIKVKVHGEKGQVRVEKRIGVQILQDFVGLDTEFGFYLQCSAKPLNIFKKSGMKCFIILKDHSGSGVENE